MAKEKPKLGPEPDRPKLEGDWKEAVKTAIRKKRPEKGWPKPEKPKLQGRRKKQVADEAADESTKEALLKLAEALDVLSTTCRTERNAANIQIVRELIEDAKRLLGED